MSHNPRPTNNLATLSNPRGQSTSYSYDSVDNLTSIVKPSSKTITNTYTNGRLDSTLTQARSYNSFGEITEVSDNTFTYELSNRDQSGAIVQKKETLNGVTTTYDYIFDDMGRLTEVKKDNVVTEHYTYDNNGNRATATVNGTSITASYTLDDNLVVYEDNTCLYDDDGYLQTKTTANGATNYSYGTMGELLVVITPTQNITYEHNANNQRAAKLINNQIVEKYLWANLTTLLAIYDKDDNIKQRFEYADSRMPVAMMQGADKFYLHYDQVGSLRVVTDSSHSIVKEIVYDTYGNILSDSNEAFKVPFGFAGGLYDTDTKLTRFGYRDYDAYTGKWTAKDPIGFDGGDSNLYGYVLGDPVNFVDSDGLKPSNKDKAEKGCDAQDAIEDGKEKDLVERGVDAAPCPWWVGCDKGKERIKDIIDKIRDRQKRQCEALKSCGMTCE